MGSPEADRKYRLKNAERIRRTSRESYHRNKHKPENIAKYKERNRKRHHLRYYGRTIEEFYAAFKKQGEVCAICKSPDPGSVKGWHQDHVETPFRLRSILCHPCNVGLGITKHNIERLQGMITYLEYWNCH